MTQFCLGEAVSSGIECFVELKVTDACNRVVVACPCEIGGGANPARRRPSLSSLRERNPSRAPPRPTCRVELKISLKGDGEEWKRT